MASKELPESEMIHEDKNRSPLWIFLISLIAIFLLLWGIQKWESAILIEKRKEVPFLRVTNREFSLFLWQNPDFARGNVFRKFGYLPHFRGEDDMHVIPQFADEYVSAPPEVLFRYHVWKRLIGNWVANRPISPPEFRQFLAENPEWLPKNWAKAPSEYKKMVELLEKQDINLLKLPLDVHLAFQGWKNYCFEMSAIESIKPTGKEMQVFLKEYPPYNRSYWRNILLDSKPHYLDSFLGGPSVDLRNLEETLPEEELSLFLKMGFYNYSLSTTTKPSS